MPLDVPMLITGSCHCGNIAFELGWEPDPAEIPARACSCTFCIKHGGVWTSCPTAALTVTVSEPERCTQYRFGTRTAEFHLCTRCGVVPVVTSRIAGALYAVVSVNAFDGVARALLRTTSATFEGEDERSRLARRQRNWIPDVRFVTAGARAG